MRDVYENIVPLPQHRNPGAPGDEILGHNLPDYVAIGAEFTESKQPPEETAVRVTRDALAVAKPMWMVGDSASDTLDWHDLYSQQVVVPVTPYDTRNTDGPKNIESYVLN